MSEIMKEKKTRSKGKRLSEPDLEHLRSFELTLDKMRPEVKAALTLASLLAGSDKPAIQLEFICAYLLDTLAADAVDLVTGAKDLPSLKAWSEPDRRAARAKFCESVQSGELNAALMKLHERNKVESMRAAADRAEKEFELKYAPKPR